MNVIRYIWKYELNLNKEQSIKVPRNSKILSVQNQLGALCLWLEFPKVSTDDDFYEYRNFMIFGTGHPIDFDDKNYDIKYISTVQIDSFVWHIYEKIKN
ncbi:MAG: DUF7352 domain-containing protein [bacterium]